MKEPDPASIASGSAGGHKVPTNAVALVVWAGIQLVPLTLSAARVPLWARIEHPVESDALVLMLVVESGASALLFPWLMRPARRGVLMILTTIPFVQLAGVLADQSLTQISKAISWVTLWQVGLCLWAAVLKNRRQQGIAVAVVSVVILGGTCTYYLKLEFDHEPDGLSVAVAWLVVWANFVLALVSALLHRLAPAIGYPHQSHGLSTFSCGESHPID